MRHLILGYGQIGRAIHEVLGNSEPVEWSDISNKEHDETLRGRDFDVLHVCIPYTDSFISAVNCAAIYFDVQLIIVHSTVPLGATKRLGDNAVHSPIRGVHPNLAKGIRTFVKYFGGPKSFKASLIFLDRMIDCRCYDDSDTTEAIKLWDTTQYGWQIVLAKEISKWCKLHGLNFDDVYREPNINYNDGYKSLDMDYVVRPWLKDMPGPIGGHCVIPNCEILVKADPMCLVPTTILLVNDELKRETENSK